MRAYENEPVIIQRDVEAIMVPGGQPITLKLGLAGYITQALGGSFTLYVEGNLYRLAGDQADAVAAGGQLKGRRAADPARCAGDDDDPGLTPGFAFRASATDPPP